MKVRRWLPPILWMGVILTATSMPSGLVPQQVGNVDKLAHFSMYAVLAALLARDGFGVAGRWGSLVFSVIVASALGAVDEWHQQYIPGRSTEYADWQADTVGAATGALAYTLLRRRRGTTSSTE